MVPGGCWLEETKAGILLLKWRTEQTTYDWFGPNGIAKYMKEFSETHCFGAVSALD